KVSLPLPPLAVRLAMPLKSMVATPLTPLSLRLKVRPVLSLAASLRHRALEPVVQADPGLLPQAPHRGLGNVEKPRGLRRGQAVIPEQVEDLALSVRQGVDPLVELDPGRHPARNLRRPGGVPGEVQQLAPHVQGRKPEKLPLRLGREFLERVAETDRGGF